MKSKVTFIEPKGTWSNGKTTYNKYQVSLANGNSYNFLAIGDFKKKVGDEIEYEVKDEKYMNAKLIQPKPQFTPNYSNRSDDTHQSILRQVAFKGAIELCSNGKIKLDEVSNFTNEFYNLINK